MESNFGDILKQLRQQENETQPMLAKILGVSRSTISMYESGAREPNFEMLEAIADHYNVDMNFLSGYNKNTSEDKKVPATETDDGQIGKIMHIVKNLNPENQNKVADYAHKLSEIQQMQEAADDSLATE